MSRRRSSGARPSHRAPGSPPRVRVLIAALAVIALVVTVVIVRTRGPGGVAPITSAPDQVLLDSLQAADARRDWVTTLMWAERLGAVRPRDHGVLLARGTAWSNFAVDQRVGRVRPRPALRTSLERMACMARALRLIDSSLVAADTPARWLESGTRIAQLHEALGLPGDALIAYESMKQRLPNEPAPAMRAYWMRALFYDPVHPDTSEWDRYMRSTGQR
jgi:hypothetical protein